MNMFEQYLFDELTEVYGQENLSSSDYEELYLRFQNIKSEEDVKPYLFAMRFLGWGTKAERESVLEELENCLSGDNCNLKGLYYDLRLCKNENDVMAKQFLEEQIAEGYKEKYLKQYSHVKQLTMVESEGRNVNQESMEEDPEEKEINHMISERDIYTEIGLSSDRAGEINDPIPYNWTLGWNNMGRFKPMVNRLLKAIIEKNVNQMERIFACGATLQKVDETTLQRVLYHILDDYNVVKCMVEHGFSGLYGNFKDWGKCWGPDGYPWGFLARAIYFEAYDVLELLAQNGFGGAGSMVITGLEYRGKEIEGEDLIFIKEDIRSVKILLENGYSREFFDWLKKKYANNKVTDYLEKNPVIKRKTIALDEAKFSTRPMPKLYEPGYWNRVEIEKKNSLLMQDYQDWIEAQKRLKEYLGESEWESRTKRDEELDEKVMIEVLEDLIKEHRERR